METRERPRYDCGMTTVEILVNGQQALTPALAAIQYGMAAPDMRRLITRAELRPVAMLDGRTPVYDAAALAAAISGRPGRGAHMRTA